MDLGASVLVDIALVLAPRGQYRILFVGHFVPPYRYQITMADGFRLLLFLFGLQFMAVAVTMCGFDRRNMF